MNFCYGLNMVCPHQNTKAQVEAWSPMEWCWEVVPLRGKKRVKRDFITGVSPHSCGSGLVTTREQVVIKRGCLLCFVFLHMVASFPVSPPRYNTSARPSREAEQLQPPYLGPPSLQNYELNNPPFFFFFLQIIQSWAFCAKSTRISIFSQRVMKEWSYLFINNHIIIFYIYLVKSGLHQHLNFNAQHKLSFCAFIQLPSQWFLQGSNDKVKQ